MQLLPLVEMFCKWELEEDCTDLWALMVRFDSEVELESHELGRSLLFMVRDDAAGLDILPVSAPVVVVANPFDVVRERLSAAANAIRGLHQQVQLLPISILHIWISIEDCNSIEYGTTFMLQNALCLGLKRCSTKLVSIMSLHKASRP